MNRGSIYLENKKQGPIRNRLDKHLHVGAVSCVCVVQSPDILCINKQKVVTRKPFTSPLSYKAVLSDFIACIHTKPSF